MSKLGSKYSSLFLLVALMILSLVNTSSSSGQNSAAPYVFTTTAQTLATSVEARIIPPQPYSVYVSQAYVLTVGVQYSVLPPDMTVFLYIVSESYTSQFAPVSGSGTVAIPLQLHAPPTTGVYNLQLTLYVRIPGQEASVWDSATVPYQVVQPVVTDWDVKRVWVEPESPGVGEQVTFHATIWIKSTTSTETLNVNVACYLDGRLYYSGSMSFQAPDYNDQDFEVPKAWTAVEGSHSVTFVVDPTGRYNDPTPYPQFNFKEVRFTVGAYYATITNISAPQEVKQGEGFDVIVTVEYKLPPNTNLKIDHMFWYGNMSQPAHNQTTDTVSGSGTEDYAFKVQAPSRGTCSALKIGGNATVMFDTGKGWKMTDPGGWGSYSVNVKSPEYYAKLGSIKAVGQPSSNQSRPILISIQVGYYLPKETGLTVTVTRSFANSSTQMAIWKDEAEFTQEPADRAMLYEFLYTFVCSDCAGDSTNLVFHATLNYLACGGWQNGGEASTQITVPNPSSAKLVKTPLDYLMAALQRIADWFKKIFGP